MNDQAYSEAIETGDEDGRDPAIDVEKKLEAMASIVDGLERLATEQKSRRQTIEDRWIEDLQQYYGQYDHETEKKLREKNQSRLFANMTRPKCHSWEARLSDMLFPTDDKNWGIMPTPVPQLTDEAKKAAEAPDGAEQAKAAKGLIAEARDRAARMSEEIEDQLVEANYNSKCRVSIRDAVRIGSGIMKGPVAGNRTKRGWGYDPIQKVYVLQNNSDPRPAYHRTNPFDFFPDMSASTMAESEFEFERHSQNRKQLRAMAKMPGFSKQALRDLLNEGPQSEQPEYIGQLRAILRTGDTGNERRFTVWEYHGSLEPADVRIIIESMGAGQDSGTVDGLHVELDDIDELEETRLEIWFCQGKVLKIGLSSLETNDSLYSVYNFEKDDTCIFGRGVPRLARDSQSAVNAAWRMTLNNAGVSAGPQIVVDKETVEPQNGSYSFTPFKVWLKTGTVAPGNKPFEIFDIPNRSGDLMAIIDIAMKFIDDETNMPLIAQGDQSSEMTQTATGMSMLMNASNVVFRNAVKNWDDDLTTPTIQRAYDWNMQFSPNGDIKGDMNIEARGSSVLLVREMQAQNLMALAMNFADHPIFGGMTKHVELYREIYKVHMLKADQFVLTDDELKEEADKAAENPQPSPEEIELTGKIKMIEAEGGFRLQIAQMERDGKMMALAEGRNVSLEQIAAELEKVRMQMDSKERIIATEVAVQTANPDMGKGGGYI